MKLTLTCKEGENDRGRNKTGSQKDGRKKKKSIEHRREEEREEARRCGGTFWESSTKNINACF